MDVSPVPVGWVHGWIDVRIDGRIDHCFYLDTSSIWYR